MAETHDYKTKLIPAKNLDSTHVLVGESGGLSAVYSNEGESNLVLGCLYVDTEHGSLYLDVDLNVEVLDE